MNLNKILFILPITIVLFLIAGCSSSNTKVDVSLKNELDNAPSWVTTQQVSGKITALGKEQKSTLNFAQQRDKAISDAQENLSTILNEKITNIFKLIKDDTVEQTQYKDTTSIALTSIVSQALKDAKIIKLWQSHTKTLYVLVSTDMKKLKNSIKISLQTTFKEMPSIHSNYSLQLEQGNIDIELSR